MKERLKKYVLSGKFKIAFEEIVKNMTFKEFDDLLTDIAYDSQSVIIYAFICYLISINNCVEYHNVAQSIMCNPLCFIDGAYETALYHNRVILEAEPNNVNANLMLLFYNTLPDKLVSDEAALSAAKNILAREPKNVVAANYISEYKNKCNKAGR